MMAQGRRMQTDPFEIRMKQARILLSEQLGVPPLPPELHLRETTPPLGLCGSALLSDSEGSKVSAPAGTWPPNASVKTVRASLGVAAIGCRKLVAMTVAVLMTIAPVASDAA